MLRIVLTFRQDGHRRRVINRCYGSWCDRGSVQSAQGADRRQALGSSVPCNLQLGIGEKCDVGDRERKYILVRNMFGSYSFEALYQPRTPLYIVGLNFSCDRHLNICISFL